MQTIFSGLKSLICFSTAARSVRSSSPSITFSTITGSNPAIRENIIYPEYTSKLPRDNGLESILGGEGGGGGYTSSYLKPDSTLVMRATLNIAYHKKEGNVN